MQRCLRRSSCRSIELLGKPYRKAWSSFEAMAAANQALHPSVSNHTENTLIALFHFVTKVKRRLLKDLLERNDLNVCNLFKEIWLFEDVKQALRKSSAIRLKDLSLNTLNYILKFHCNDLFWNTCLDDGKVTFEEFLNTHSSEIYELTKCNSDNSSSCALPTSTVLSNKNFERLFNRSFSLFSFFTGNMGKISAKRGIDIHSLNQDVHDVLLDFFCPLRRSVSFLTEDQRAICKNIVFKETINQEIWPSVEKHISIIAEKYKRKKSELLKVQSLRSSYLEEKQCLENRKRMLEDALNDAAFVQDQGFCDRLRQELHSLSQDENLFLINQLCCKEISIILLNGQYRNGMYQDAVLISADTNLECLKAAYCSEVDDVPFDTTRKDDIKSYNENIEKHHYLKLIQLIMEVGRNVFIDVLKDRLPAANYGHAFIGMKDRLYPFLYDAVYMYKKLFPEGSVYSGDLTDLDLSVLYIILRNLGTIPPHSKFWGHTPDPTDRSISANLDRIREAKNFYVSHFPGCSISYEKFKKAWDEIRQCIVELVGEKYNADIDILLTRAINPLIESEWIEYVKNVKKNERLKTRDVAKLTVDLNGVKDEVRGLYSRVNRTSNEKEEGTTGQSPLTAILRIEGRNLPTVQDLEPRMHELSSEDVEVQYAKNGSLIFGLELSAKTYLSVGCFLHVLDGFLGKIFLRHTIHEKSSKVIVVSMEITDRYEYLKEEKKTLKKDMIHDEPITDGRDEADTKELRQMLRDISRDLYTWISQTHEIVEQLNLLSKDLDEHFRIINIAKVSGAAGAIAGGAMTLFGFILNPFTFGGSNALSVAGGALAGAGEVTVRGSAAANDLLATNRRKTAESLLRIYSDMSTKIKHRCLFISTMLETYGEIENDFPDWLQFWAKAVKGTDGLSDWKDILEILDSAIGISSASLKPTAQVEAAALSIAGAGASVGLHVLGGGAGLLFTPLDIFTLVDSAIVIHKKNPHQVSNNIRSLADNIKTICPTKNEVDKMINCTIANL